MLHISLRFSQFSFIDVARILLYNDWFIVLIFRLQHFQNLFFRLLDLLFDDLRTGQQILKLFESHHGFRTWWYWRLRLLLFDCLCFLFAHISIGIVSQRTSLVQFLEYCRIFLIYRLIFKPSKHTRLLFCISWTGILCLFLLFYDSFLWTWSNDITVSWFEIWLFSSLIV